MTKKTSTKRALVMSVLSLLLCVSMFVGTTFAWFTDSVTSAGNIIKSGSLDVEMLWSDDNATWKDASAGAIFDYKYWEPGYTEIKYIKVKNAGDLAFKYQINIIPDAAAGAFDLADVIDVYMLDATATIDRNDVDSAEPRGTLAGLIANGAANGYLLPTDGSDRYNGVEAPRGEITYCIALKMQESAGNDYQDLTVGNGFSVQLLATQYTWEEDSFGDDYDTEATLDFTPVSNANELRRALNEKKTNILLNNNIATDAVYTVDYDANINGNGYVIYRDGGAATANADANAPAVYTGVMFTVKAGTTLTLENVTVDGGAVWTGAVDEVLQRGTVNAGITATGAVIATEGNGNIVLNKGAVLQNHYSASAVVNLATRGNGTLTLNGGKIINNTVTNGAAIWLGGATVVNDGSVISGNSGTLGGVFRSVDSQSRYNVSVTVNGGEISHNTAPSGGVIWSGNGLVVTFAGGEIAYNHATSAGGVLWGGSKDKYYITGDVEIHNNTAGELGNVFRLNHYLYPTLEMTGGKVYDNTCAATPYAFYFVNDYVKLLGGEIKDDILYTGGVDFTMGDVQIDGTIHFSLDTTHKRILLADSFSTLHFTVAENDAHYSNVHFVPAAGYTYTEGDEAKLICMNAGYETYWDAATGTFRLQAI